MKRIALLYGGTSSERDISIMSATSVDKSLKRLGYTVFPLEINAQLPKKILEAKADLAFIVAHGKYGEDGCVQGLLECLKIPYTHSSVMQSAVCMNKPLTKVIFSHLGIEIAYHKIVTKSEILSNRILYNKRYVLKPTSEGSSRNVYMFDREHNFTAENYPFDGDVMLEEYIYGRELHAAMISRNAIGVVEIMPKKKLFYDYETKYTDGLADHIIPARIPKDIYNRCLNYSERVNKYLKCGGISRADFRYDERNDRLVMLEFNTIPGFTNLSLVPEIAKKCCNIDFDQLVEMIINDAIQNQKK